MIREEAIERLNIHKSTSVFVDSIAEAIDMAIEALTCQNLSKPNNTCKVDLIIRADAIEAVRKEYEDAVNIGDNGDAIAYDVGRILSALPSVPEVVHIETYRELYEKYVNLKHASGESTKPEVTITDTDIMYVGENYKV